MYDVMEGVRVVEVAEHTFVPSAAMILADWGADVIKIERPADGGDAGRTMRVVQRPGLRVNPFFEAANRGKRSVGLDLTRPEGREQLYRLVDDADVFITNMRDDARAKLGIEAADLMARRPRLIYANATGYGQQGPMAASRGFDYPSSWCRSGSAYVQTGTDGCPAAGPAGIGGRPLRRRHPRRRHRRRPVPAGAHRARRGRPPRPLPDGHLHHEPVAAQRRPRMEAHPGAGARTEAPDPANNIYRTKDGRWLVLCLLYDQWWPDLVRTLHHEEWLSDPRYADPPARADNHVSLIAELDGVFATRTLSEWEAELARLEGVWSPLKSPDEVIVDAQALENGFVTPVTFPDGGSYLTGASPAQFDRRPIGELRAAPEHGQDTEAVLRELGLTDEQIAGLRDKAVIA